MMISKLFYKKALHSQGFFISAELTKCSKENQVF